MQQASPRVAYLLMAVLLAPLLVSACAHTVTTTIDDATISTRVKTALLNDPDIALARIEVETVKGTVTLTGRLKSKEEETKAIALARTVKGVTDVRSNLQISQ